MFWRRMRVAAYALALLLLGAGGGYWYWSEHGERVPACWKETVCFEKRTATKEQLATLLAHMDAGRIAYACRFVPSTHMASILTHHIDAARLKTQSEAVFGKESTPDAPVQIRGTLHENDKLDPNKKSQSCKLFAGYLLYEFVLEGELLYKIQIDVVQPKGEDIPERLRCMQESIKAHAL